MELSVFSDYEEMSAAAAKRVIRVVLEKPGALLCFATGDTPVRTYARLVEEARELKIDFTKCIFIGLDEWVGISPANPGSCHHFLHKHLIEPLGLQTGQVHLFDIVSRSPQQACDQMNAIVEQTGPVDCLVAGVGMNGHIGFNEPGSSMDQDAFVARLDPLTSTVGQKYFDTPVVIDQGVTLGLRQIMQSKLLLMLANGSKKAGVIKRALEEPPGTSFPASLVRLHHNAALYIDQEAASEIKNPGS